MSVFDQLVHSYATHHVLSEALAQSDVVSILDKVPRGKSVAVRVAASKALVGHVEKGKVALLLHLAADLAPLILRGINTSRVVRAGVEDDDAVAGSSLDVGNQAFKVQADGIFVVVAVFLNLEAAVLEHRIMVGPARSGNVDCLRMGVETLKESAANPQSAGTRDGLGDAEAVLLDDGRVRPVGELRSGRGEGRDTCDTSVFLVEIRRDDLVFGVANGRQDIGFALVVALELSAFAYVATRLLLR